MAEIEGGKGQPIGHMARKAQE